jgi:branched-chain amino acid aminotransferase
MPAKFSWMNGQLVPWTESRIHIASEAVLRGASVFEGIRAYRTAAGDLLLFRVRDHLDRLFHTSMRFQRLRIEYGPDDLLDGICDLLTANEVGSDVHIRVVAYFDELRLGSELETAGGVFITATENLLPPGRAMRVTLSPWRRLSDLAMAPRIKASANYVNSRVAIVDAQSKGFDSAVLLNERGKVSEGPSMNLFMVRGGVLYTPRISDGILEGITRDTVLAIADANGITAVEREIDATELYIADELFFCGTAYEITPIVEIDKYQVGSGEPGPVTQQIRQVYESMVRGEVPTVDGWVTPVVQRQEVPAH